MAKRKKAELKFTIPEATPTTIPMARLAEYLKKLSILFGHEKSVHFLRMDKGSASAVAFVEPDFEAHVIERTRNASVGDGPKEAVYSYESVKEMLEEDGYSAKVTRNGELIAEFLQRVERDRDVIGPVWQDGTLDGLLVRIEGMDETIHVTLISDRRRYPGETNRDLGMKLGPLFYKTVRVFGRGKWWRNAHGEWELEKFIFQAIEPAEDISLPEVVARLRALPNDLQKLEDPLGEMLKIRHGD
jgi:hypothetical protein